MALLSSSRCLSAATSQCSRPAIAPVPQSCSRGSSAHTTGFSTYPSHQHSYQQLPGAVTSGYCRQVKASALANYAVNEHDGDVMAAPGSKYGIVVGRFNSLITYGLLEGALATFKKHGVAAADIDVAYVPGSFELPVVAKSMAKSGQYAAVVCIGAIIRGATAHYDAVVSATTSGVLNASLDSGIPVIFGVLTTDDLDQALDRTGGKVGNKGGEAALTAIETATLLANLQKQKKAVKSW